MTTYVLGFLFDEGFDNVVLVRQGKPASQKGKINGIGGRVKPADISPLHAMDRVFEGKAGVMFGATQKFCTITDRTYVISCFSACSTGRLWNAKSCTKEQVIVFGVPDVLTRNTDILPSLRWLIPMAIEFKRNGDGFYHADIVYSASDIRQPLPG